MQERRWLLMRAGAHSFIYRMSSLRHLGANGASVGPHINGSALSLTLNKGITKAIAFAAGVGVPRGLVFYRSQRAEALGFFRSLGTACVKPSTGQKGVAVFPNVANRAQFLRAFDAVSQRYRQVLVEQSVKGEVFRFFFVGQQAVAARIGIPANVIGDGEASIESLVERKNVGRTRQLNPIHKPIKIDRAAERMLAEAGLDRQTVPQAGQRVFLHRTSNLATGGDSIDYTDRMHPSYFQAVGKACRAIPGLKIAGIDVMIRDCSAPAVLGNYHLLEVNSGPGILGHHFPWEGKPRNVAANIAEFLATYSDHQASQLRRLVDKADQQADEQRLEVQATSP